MDLKQYEQEKFRMARFLRSAQASGEKNHAREEQAHALLERLAEDRFTLMVVGRFSRGKSTLINALLGSDLLPTGIVPLTSVITTVSYGSRKQAVLHTKGRGLPREIPLEELPLYATERENPGNRKGISSIGIELPVSLLRRGVYFVDSPGLGSAIEENTATTERFLPEADAFVLVTSFEGPLSQEENQMLGHFCTSGKPLFVVLNKQDAVTDEEREEAIQFVKQTIHRYRWQKEPAIFSVSARQALKAKLADDRAALEQSGLPLLEASLMHFLLEERAEEFLSSMRARIVDSLSVNDGDAAQKQLEAFLHAEQTAPQEVSPARHESQAQIDSTAAAMAEDSSLRLQLHPKTGCQICAAILEAGIAFLSSDQYQLSTDPQAQQEHAQRHGFCPLHTWQYETVASPYGVCTAYPPLLHRMAAALAERAEAAEEQRAFLASMIALLPTRQSCRACEASRAAEQRAIEQWAEWMRRATPEDRLPGCCLEHLQALLAQLEASESAAEQGIAEHTAAIHGAAGPAARLLRAHAQQFERTAEDLERYALRHDALRRSMTSLEERQAHQLALLLLAGHRSLSTAIQRDFSF